MAGSLFIDPDNLPLGWKGDCQIAFLGFVYTYMIMQGCDLLGDGSELLEATRWKRLIGSTIVPVLGAVPDAAIVFFSGIGDNAQSQLDTGMGALAGSTVMLLTVPYILAIFGGSVDLFTNKDPYENGRGTLQNPSACGLFTTGVQIISKPVIRSGIWMGITVIPYLIIEVPAIEYFDADDSKLTYREKKYSLIGAIACLVLFFGYLLCEYLVAEDEDHKEEKSADKKTNILKNGTFGIKHVLKEELASVQVENVEGGVVNYGTEGRQPNATVLKTIQPFFEEHAMLYTDEESVQEGQPLLLNEDELNVAFRDLGIKKSAVELKEVFRSLDKNHDGGISATEFALGVEEFAAQIDTANDEDDSDDPMTQAVRKLFFGSLLVLLFSDPLVDVVDSVGDRTGISDFYLAFIFAPMVTNGSELTVSYKFAQKKTKDSITCSLQQLYGAGTMNNTMTLGVFLLLVYLQDLYWDYDAEVICIVIIELIMVALAWKSRLTRFHAVCVLTLYPLCLIGTALLESQGVP